MGAVAAHPDRFAHEPDKLETYAKLTSPINQAKDNGDIAVLREIADDPHGFILEMQSAYLVSAFAGGVGVDPGCDGWTD